MEGREEKEPLLITKGEASTDQCLGPTGRRVWEELKKLWSIVGPAVVTRVAINSMNLVTKAYAGHLGELELASISIALTVITGFSFGLLLGMASAMETMCGQAYGAKKFKMMGIYLQRSWIILFICAVILLPIYVFATQILLLIGQDRILAKQAGQLSIWFIPVHFAYVLLLPQQRFLQCQGKNLVNTWTCAAAFVLHAFISWIFMQKLRLGLVAAVITLNFSWWVIVLVQFGYIVFGGCPQSWKGFSLEAFSDLWEFVKLSMASGVMLCLENWYYKALILIGGYLKDAKTGVDALAVCQNINSWEFMIPLAFFAGTGVRVANELGAGNGKGAKFATIVSIITSALIGIFFCSLILIFHDKFGLLFISSEDVLKVTDKLSSFLAVTILLNSVQPILSGVAVGSGWQSTVAYVNVGSYYLIGVPAGILLGWTFHLDVRGIWTGMIGGTVVQTLILAFLTYKCNWENEAIIASERMSKWDISQKR